MMIRYTKFVTIQRNRNGDWSIESDCGDKYLTQRYSRDLGNTSATPITTWYNQQFPSELRHWQKDICVLGFSQALKTRNFSLFTIYKQGQGYNQNHDMCLVHYPDHQLWVFSTGRDFWVCNTDSGQFQVRVNDSLGSVEDPDVRKMIYDIFDRLEKETVLG